MANTLAIQKGKIGLVKKLYQERKLTLREVAENLGVGIDAVVYCMRKNGIKRRSFKEANAIAFEKKKLSFRERTNLSEDQQELKTIGLILYWAEGYKSELSHGVDLANSDPIMVKIFMKFLRTIYRIDESRLRILLYCYKNQNIPNLINFWSKITRIPRNQFSKPYVREDFKENGRKMQYGMVHVRYADKKLLLSIMESVNQIKFKCVGTQVVNEGTL